MAIGANSYGDTAEIAALVPKWRNTAGRFDEATNPTLSRVEGLVDMVSAVVNSVLAENGFDIPVSQADVKLALDMFVNEEVAQVVEGMHGSGRFGPENRRAGNRWNMSQIWTDARDFIENSAAGFETLGADRTNDMSDQIAFKETDFSGNEVAPIFQREAFGNKFSDWDPD